MAHTGGLGATFYYFMDPIGRILGALRTGETWTKGRLILKAELIFEMKSSNYIMLSGKKKEFSINKVGKSIIYRVPTTKTGYLKPFRDKTLRIVCTGYIFRTQYKFMAGLI